MEYYLDRVTLDKKDILYRLLEYSLFEESLTDGNEMNDEAIYEYKYFDTYFTDNTRDAFFIKEKESNKLLGFVLINTYTQKIEKGHSIAEFLIIPKYRRNHIGSKVATDCFNMYKGNWEVSPSIGNEIAKKFWLKTIEKYTNDNYTYEDRIISFLNKE